MSWFSRFINAVNSKRLDDDLAEEMADHVARRTADLNRQGLSTGESRRQANLRFGNTTRLREESRDFRLWAKLDGTIQDIRFASRGIRKGPAFAATAVLSLALAIGAITAIYSLVDAAILRPLPVSRPNQLFSLSWTMSDPGSLAGEERDLFNDPEFLRFSAAIKGVARLAFFSSQIGIDVQWSGPDSPMEKVNRGYVSGKGFDILGVRPTVGHLFSGEENRSPSAPATAVLSYEYWQRRFGSDPAVVGKNLKIADQVYQVAGVTQKGFWGVEPGLLIDLWLPGALSETQALNNPGWHWFRILGRNTSGVSLQRIQAKLQPSYHDFQVERVKMFLTMPAALQKRFLSSAIRVNPAANGISDFRKSFSGPLWIVFDVASVILIIACANVASLLLARATARAAEMATRISLGAGRVRLARQMLTESLTLSFLAGVFGWLIALISTPLLVRVLSTEGNPVQFALAIDTRVLLFCVAISTLSAVLFGIAPAVRASGTRPITSLRASAGKGGKLRLSKVFVSVEVACAFCLVLVGGAFLFSLFDLFRVNPGFDARNVAVFDIVNDSGKKSTEVQRELMFQFRNRVMSHSNIQAASLAWWPILQQGGWSGNVIIPGKGPSEQEVIFYRVSPGYFASLRTPLISGRDFEQREGSLEEPQPVIVNEAFARRYFDEGDAVGRTFSYPTHKSNVRVQVIGVAADAHYYDLRTPAAPLVYLPLESSAGFTMYVRSELNLGSVARIVEQDATATGSGTRVRGITTLETLVGNTLLREKLLAGVGGACAFFGLLLAAIGLFGLLSYSVGRRTKELGIRAALGAQRDEIVSLVLKEVVALMSAGLIIGLVAALATMIFFRSLLFGIQKIDPIVIGTAMALFIATALVAVCLPARRAATLDPIRALREE